MSLFIIFIPFIYVVAFNLNHVFKKYLKGKKKVKKDKEYQQVLKDFFKKKKCIGNLFWKMR